MQNSILLQNVSTDSLVQLINEGVKSQLDDFKKNFNAHNTEELLTREEAIDLLKIDSSTLWRWTKQGKVNVYGIAARRYYKKAEILEKSLILLISKK
jgi:hypothetical protein